MVNGLYVKTNEQLPACFSNWLHEDLDMSPEHSLFSDYDMQL